MAMSGEDALNLAKAYVKKTMQGAGALKGQDGKDGTDGKSAYELAVANGFEGTEQEWITSLQGQDGEDGDGATKISQEADNQIQEKEDGIYVPPTDLSGYAKTEEVKEALEDKQDVINGTAGQYVGFNAEGKAVAVEAPDSNEGSSETVQSALIVTCNYEVDYDNNWIIRNVSETFENMQNAALSGRDVVLKAYPYADTTNPYILRMVMYMEGTGIAFCVMMPDGDSILGLTVMIMSDESVNASRSEYDFGATGDETGSDTTENPVLVFKAEIDEDTQTVVEIYESFTSVHEALVNGKMVQMNATVLNRGDTVYVFHPLFISGNTIAFDYMNSAAKMGLQISWSSDGEAYLVTTTLGE